MPRKPPFQLFAAELRLENRGELGVYEKPPHSGILIYHVGAFSSVPIADMKEAANADTLEDVGRAAVRPHVVVEHLIGAQSMCGRSAAGGVGVEGDVVDAFHHEPHLDPPQREDVVASDEPLGHVLSEADFTQDFPEERGEHLCQQREKEINHFFGGLINRRILAQYQRASMIG